MTRLARLVAVFLMAVAVSLVAVSAASAARYPTQVRQSFISQCYKAAKQTADGKIPNAKLRKGCKVSLRCIEGKLTLKQFSRASTSDRAIRKCIRKGAEAIAG